SSRGLFARANRSLRSGRAIADRVWQIRIDRSRRTLARRWLLRPCDVVVLRTVFSSSTYRCPLVTIGADTITARLADHAYPDNSLPGNTLADQLVARMTELVPCVVAFSGGV